jgi:hypothetical protein
MSLYCSWRCVMIEAQATMTAGHSSVEGSPLGLKAGIVRNSKRRSRASTGGYLPPDSES